jgi:hypothetical protein
MDRLAAILTRLESPFDGERAAAALLASRELRKLGLTWQELVGARHPASETRPSWRDLVAQCRRHPAELTAWEADFLGTLAAYRTISERQREVLAKIAGRLGMTDR